MIRLLFWLLLKKVLVTFFFNSHNDFSLKAFTKHIWSEKLPRLSIFIYLWLQSYELMPDYLSVICIVAIPFPGAGTRSTGWFSTFYSWKPDFSDSRSNQNVFLLFKSLILIHRRTTLNFDHELYIKLALFSNRKFMYNQKQCYK